MQPLNQSIHDFYMKEVFLGNIQLPEFQRGFEWRFKQQQELFESIFQGHPIGTILILELDGQDPFFAWTKLQNCSIPKEREFSVWNKTKKPKGVGPPSYLILDGQQRLTTIAHLTNNLGNKSWYLDLKQLLNSWTQNDKPEKIDDIRNWLERIELVDMISKRKWIENPERFFTTVELRFPLCFLASQDICDARVIELRRRVDDEVVRLKNEETQKHDSNERQLHLEDLSKFLDGPLRRICDGYFGTEIPTVVVGKETSIIGVCKVFTKLNTTGISLGPFDLTVARLFPSGERLKARMDDSIDKHPALEILDSNRVTVLSTVALLAGKSPKKASLPITIEAEDIKKHWEDAINSLLNAGQALSRYCGAGLDAGDQKLLVYAPILPPLALVLSKHAIADDVQAGVLKDRVRKLQIWYFASALHRRYSEGTDNKQVLDSRVFSDWFSDIGEPNGYPDWLADLSKPNLAVARSSALGKAVLSLLNFQRPKDWFHNEPLGHGEDRANSDLHHIFPRAAMREMVGQERHIGGGTLNRVLKEEYSIDSVLNLTWLLDKTNREIIKDELPSVYLSRLVTHFDSGGGGQEEVKKKLQDHFIDDVAFERLLKNDYFGFIEARQRVIYAKLNALGIQTSDLESVDEE